MEVIGESTACTPGVVASVQSFLVSIIAAVVHRSGIVLPRGGRFSRCTRCGRFLSEGRQRHGRFRGSVGDLSAVVRLVRAGRRRLYCL